jgi:hypothetical protein
MLTAMTSSGPENLSSSTRKTALVVARLMFYLGLMLGMLMGAAAVTILFTGALNFPTQTERWLSGGVIGGLCVMAFGFSAMGKARIEKLK